MIETAIGELKEICQIQHHGHRSPNNFLAVLFLRALGLCLQTQIYLIGKI
ncbi:MAG: hypothetical protein MRQ11_05965 [Candidatus Midichloria mitochondrii]|nr:hypothetical protein [Candidatus Midichloria mitochondrii]MDJ1313627.1 hypothetical protein [Candidatus Midichloria mitochondrii]MDJ1584201.1 hypothetical protein [Candidatus Midichloria mitochondrii]